MTKITTEDNCVHVNDSLIPKNGSVVSLLTNGVRIGGDWGRMNILTDNTEINGVPVTSNQELFDFFKANSFNQGGTEPSNGVLSVTGDLVDNSNPENPIIKNDISTSFMISRMSKIPLKDGMVGIYDTSIGEVVGVLFNQKDGVALSTLMLGETFASLTVGSDGEHGVKVKDTGIANYGLSVDISLFGDRDLIPKSYVTSVASGLVQKDGNKILSDNNFTDEHKQAVENAHETVFRGRFPTLEALQTEIPIGQSGWYAHVEGMNGTTPIVYTYMWVELANAWEPAQGESGGYTDQDIKQMYERNLNTNAYTDDDKLNNETNTTHRGLTNNPHGVTKSQVGLGSVDDTADKDKIVSDPQKLYIDNVVGAHTTGTLSLKTNGQVGFIELFSEAGLKITRKTDTMLRIDYNSYSEGYHYVNYRSFRTASFEQTVVDGDLGMGETKLLDADMYSNGVEYTEVLFMDDRGRSFICKFYVRNKGVDIIWSIRSF